MFGLVEVITLLLGLAGFGLQPNPKAPTADQSLQYAMPDADVVVHFDAASVIPNNYKMLSQLADQPQIKASPELAKMVRQLVNEVEGARGIAKTATGIDLATDITDGTLFVQIVPGNREPLFVAAVRGKLSTAVVDKIGKMTGKQATKVGNGMIIEVGPDSPAIAVTKDGVMLAGTPKLVRDRLAETWKAPVRTPGSNLAYAEEVINAKPVFAVVLTMSVAARKEIQTKMGSKNFITDILGRHKLLAFSMFHDGIGWTWVDSTKAGLDQMAMMSDGMIDMLRAFQIAPRGFAKIMLGAIDSYKGTDKRVDEIIRRKADILKIIDSYSGDGNFKVQVDKDPKTLRLTVRATGKTLSEVVPAGFVGPGIIAGALLFRGGQSQSKTSVSPMPVAPIRQGTPIKQGTMAPIKPGTVAPAPTKRP
ncbi:MAG: hypothetical protein H6Q90_3449 [Deltaproteobacteria bacterium]|nr:hypothetical protein [Deltaproteobacteria bacterium]